MISATATLVQFPVKSAHSITGHKVQGQTVEKPLKVAFDLRNIFEDAQGYVMLSRVQEMGQVFILEKFEPQKLYPSKKALQELERMNKISINENPSEWTKTSIRSIKLLSMNVAGLKNHFSDVQADDKLMHADLISFTESSLLEEEREEMFTLSGYNGYFIKAGSGKGVASYTNNKSFEVVKDIVSQNYQVLKVQHHGIISIYRSQGLNSAALLNDLEKIEDITKVTIIMGDFNLCYNENRCNRLIQGLLGLGFNQLVQEPTHVRGRIIDHVYFLDPIKKFKISLERYSPYYTDHDAFCITISERVEK